MRGYPHPMITIPRMIMIGSIVGSAGKTELACRIIRKFSPFADIAGIKVTPDFGDCGSGVRREVFCGERMKSDDHDILTREKDRRDGTDTARMLAAGAWRAFWLRTQPQFYEDACMGLLDVIGNYRAIVCESTGLRRTVEPGLFLVVRGKESDTLCDPSCREVIGYADRIIVFEPPGFDIDLDEIGFAGGKWFLKSSHDRKHHDT
ncbi:hypothetical protein LLG96_08360 [bacterium]|nr:hypothetical protein [bacterium]